MLELYVLFGWVFEFITVANALLSALLIIPEFAASLGLLLDGLYLRVVLPAGLFDELFRVEDFVEGNEFSVPFILSRMFWKYDI